MEHRVRAVATADLVPVAALWHRARHEVRDALVRVRTGRSFEERAARHGPRMLVPGPPLGLCTVDGDELRDGEARMRAAGTRRAWLACAVGDDRAARFDGRHGWSNAGAVLEGPETDGGGFPLDVPRFGKALLEARTSLPGGA